MKLINVYARREKTVDPIDIQHGCKNRTDTVIYRDKECTTLFARWPWHFTGWPRRNSKTVMLNCYRWNLVWVN